MEPWERTIRGRWDEFERLFESDWEDDQPGPRLIEAVEALVDDWWSVLAEDVVREMERRPRLRVVVAQCTFDRGVPVDVTKRLYEAAGGTE